ncbi:helix-turn-helix domain-containing protein [Corynebacterium sp. H127]|uniref:helix-turn-helix domain-containing protein n=1 Tax=Corynebacterium sp. H127 TaxID=3133418 RepID=UPI00403F6FA5
MPNGLSSRSREIATEVRAELARQEISVNEVAETTGIPISTLRRSVKGHRSFTVDELFAVTRMLNISVSGLVQKAERAAAA